MHLIAASLYAALSARLWQTRWHPRRRGQQAAQAAPNRLGILERALLLAALFVHGATLGDDIIDGNDFNRFAEQFLFRDGAKDQPADASEPVDSNFCHKRVI